ncbi:MAG TPA: hypothetical protein VLG16_01075 [Candidatus Saccharimonadales bacterium]|nr:hypothetical protein [Candidatus Saccharimonadales bacterium]
MSDLFEVACEPIESDEIFNLIVVRSVGHIALGQKTRGYGRDKLVLPGGKERYCLSSSGVGILLGAYDASRELFEETGIDLDPSLLSEVGRLNIDTEDDTRLVKVLTGSSRKVPLKGDSELTGLDWYPEISLPYEKMPRDYGLWLPHVLAGYVVTAFLDTDEGELLGGHIFRQHIDPLERAELIPVDLSQS